MKKWLILFLLLLVSSFNVFAFEWLNASIGTRNYGGTNYVTLEFDITGSPVPDEGFFGCSSKSALFSPDASNRFGIDWIGSNGVPSVQIDLTSGHISYILQTSYSMPTCANGTDLFFGLGYTGGGSPYVMTHVVALRNLGTTSAPVWTAPFLGFPLPSLTPYTATISGVVDHSVSTGFNCADNVVTAYTGEQGSNSYAGSSWSTTATGSGCSGSLYGWAKANPATAFTINGHYDTSASNEYGEFLFYDGHNGYDYPAAPATPVNSAAGGTAYFHNWGTNNMYHDVKVDHGNGYTTFYLHLSDDHAYIYDGKPVLKGEQIGASGNFGGANHLHFTVWKGSARVDPYGWTGTGADPLQIDGHDNVCLWDACP